ncbi:hypothetical protein [Halosimplex pelagicum]|uniref:Lipoprotein n=1 Tax=Halosimplex pelagicum TaxID=869886 RepID=A0A7D5PFZ7_9EURY|nr:hypothetical protein [Halosimplex pelagicum]QLH83920.1 hypothetical protein HZS54_20795 [Halosimplex pelagicum]
MRRRALLAGLAAGSAGCLGRTGPGTDGPTDSGTDSERTPAGDTATRTVEPAEQKIPQSDPEAESPDETYRLGDGPPSGAQAHELVVWRDGPVRPVTVEVSAPAADIAVSPTPQLEPGAYLLFELTERVDYEVAVHVKGGTWYGFDIAASYVDCNDSRTTVRAPESEPVEYGTFSTSMACSVGTASTAGGDG